MPPSIKLVYFWMKLSNKRCYLLSEGANLPFLVYFIPFNKTSYVLQGFVHNFSYLKLYKTLPLSKLATFMRPVLERSGSNIDTEKELTKQLLCFKHKMKNMVWTKGGSGLDGSFQSGSEVSLNFYKIILIR